MVWAQVFPFVALAIYDGGEKSNLQIMLISYFAIWLVLNIAFFCTIDLTYLHTFFGTKTAPQYTCELFLTSQEDSAKFRAAFKSRSSYTKAVHGKVKEWVAENIDRWQAGERAKRVIKFKSKKRAAAFESTTRMTNTR